MSQQSQPNSAAAPNTSSTATAPASNPISNSSNGFNHSSAGETDSTRDHVDHQWAPDSSTSQPSSAFPEAAGAEEPDASDPSHAHTSTDQQVALATDAASYDPFKGTEYERHPKAARASARQPNSSPHQKSTTSPGMSNSRNYPQMPVFPGQSGTRELAKPVSAIRTSDNSASDVTEEVNPPATADDGTSRPEYEANNANTHAHRSSSTFNSAPSSSPSKPFPPNAHPHLDSNAPDASMSYSGVADMSMDSSFASTSEAGGEGNKRKKTYKYLQDDPTPSANGERAPGEKRKKVQKACRPCKRSHMPCLDQRPCPRCIKRGIPDLCVDAEPIARRPRKTNEVNTEQSASEAGVEERASEIEQLAKAAEEMSSAAAAAAAAAAVAQEQNDQKHVPILSDLDQEQQEALRKAVSPSEEDLMDQFGMVPLRLLADPALAEASQAVDAQPQSTNQFEQDNAAATTNASPRFSYTRSYVDLANWCVQNLSQQVAAEVEAVVGSARSRLLQAGVNCTKEDLEALEAQTVASLENQRHQVIDSVPLVMLLLRRTGEIYAVNSVGIDTLGTAHSNKTNVIQLGQERQSLALAEMLNQATTVNLGRSVSQILSLLSGSSESSVSKRFIVTMQAAEWATGTGLPLGVTCCLTPLEL